jgi:acetylornithine deacetylase/succinyl-diaminopimelate desuccinylase-like protein
MRELTARMVSAAGGSRTRGRLGVNLLFYGPPGTGKTEFAKTLGAQVGFSVQFVGETNDKNGEPSRSERLAALLIANAIGAVARRTILVVDEADDVFDAFNEVGRHGSKVFLNRLLERSAAPTIWIANDPDRLGPAIVRRMTLALRFPKPQLSVRKAMVSAIAETHGLRLDEESKLTLARAIASPAPIDNAIRSAALISGSAGDATNILQAGLLASGGAQPPRPPTPMPFDPALSSADVDLVALADRIVKSHSLARSFLLSGPPGTGKSAFARHVAERLDLELVEKSYSDLVSVWLGESEKAIALAFEEAADLGQMNNGDGPCFAFNSHMDTVPAGGDWRSDPFCLTERDGKLFGRGACDAKGPVVAMAEAGRLLASQRDLWHGTLVFMFVADEEIDGGGSRALAKQQPRPDLIVVGEPTNNAVYTAHKGCLRPLIRAKGKAAHSGRPELGVNAILAAGHLTSIFDERDRELRTQTHRLVGHASLTVTRIAGGIADNVVPDNCELVLDRRLLPGETLDAALDELNAMLTRAKRDHGATRSPSPARRSTIRWYGSLGASFASAIRASL